MGLRILVRGGGDLASGAIMRLHRAGWQVIVLELGEPRSVRRYVSFAQAVYAGEFRVEEILARRVESLDEVFQAIDVGIIPVLVDPGLNTLISFQPHVILDGRMMKKPPETGLDAAELVIGLGPGFIAGENCHAVIETNRGPFLGRVIWQGKAQDDTGIPEQVGNYRVERVLRAPETGRLEALAEIGQHVDAEQVVARVGAKTVLAPFKGVVRGLIKDGLLVRLGEKIGDVDPRDDPQLCWLVSDKALSVGGGVVEAILSTKSLRRYLG